MRYPCLILTVVLLVVFCLELQAAPQSQVFGGGECNQPNSIFKRCEKSTRGTCLVPEPDSDKFATHCEDGCFCLDGYYYNSNNQCVLLEDCDGQDTSEEDTSE